MTGIAISNEPLAPATANPFSRKWLTRLAVLSVIGLTVYWFRAPILEQTARVFIVDEDPADATHVLLYSGDRKHQIGLEMWQNNSDRVVMLPHRRLRRTERMGLVQSREEHHRLFLLKAGVPPDHIAVLPNEVRDDWEFADSLSAWLAHHPRAQVAVVCERISTRKLAQVLADVLGPYRRRIRIVALPNSEYDETNWWHTKSGMLAVLHSTFQLAYFTFLPRRPPAPEWDPDSYEGSLK
jgi:hypothetical protein